MTINPDLHPDDATHRRDVVAELRALRITAGLTHADVAATLHVRADAVSKFETRRPNPQIITVQRYARAIGRIADLVLHGITWPTTADMRTYAAVATVTDSPMVADVAIRSLCIARLAAARRRQGLTRFAAAKRMGINDNTLYQFEVERQEALLSTYQRYARALGGRLTVELQQVESATEARAA